MNNAHIIRVSIIIPTHNRAELLRQTLKSLIQLIIQPGTSVELLVIANACTDETVHLCQALRDTMPFSFRCITESQVGLGYARNRGLLEAEGEIIAFLDDDVSVDSHWLAGLLEIFDRYPADVVAGKVTLWWQEVEKPSWMTHRSEHLLSSVDFGDQVRELFTAGEAVGANFAIRLCVLADVAKFRTDLDRQGRAVLAGGDTYFISRALKTGHRMFYAPRAAIRHWVTPERVTLHYLSRVAYANGLARIQMLDNPLIRTRIILAGENIVKYYFYGAMEVLSRGVGYTRGRINNHIRRMACQGVLEALNVWRG